MKEYERIIKSGLVDEEFIKPEEKCGYLVTAERKKLFSVLLDMLYQFDRVCQKHGLVYFIMYGTLLGAVRHKGFIPWDDDMDVVMPREDYEKFMRLKDEFKEPLFFQTPYTDPGYFYTPIRIRNSNTTAIVEKFKYAGFNHGIWFSVFPLDNWSEADGRKKYSEINELVVKESTYMRISNPHLSSADQQRVALYMQEQRDPMKDYEMIHQLASSCKDTNSKKRIVAVCTMDSYDTVVFDSTDFSKPVFLEFEGLQVMAPCGYKNILKVLYNDYMELPPIEKRGNWHTGVVIDTDVSYKEYLAKEGIVI